MDNIRKRLEDEAVARQGNLVAIEGYVQSNSYENDDEKMYDTSLVVQDFEILSFAKQL